MQQAGVVERGHDGEQRVDTRGVFRCAVSARAGAAPAGRWRRRAENRPALRAARRLPDSAGVRVRRGCPRARRSGRGSRRSGRPARRPFEASIRRRGCSRRTPAGGHRTSAAPATSKPTIQIAPRCALLPPVACIMACSPARPICASSARRVADGALWRAARASAAKVGSSACAERSMVSRSRSRCAPLPRRSTKAGFGVSCASSINAVMASRASHASAALASRRPRGRSADAYGVARRQRRGDAPTGSSQPQAIWRRRNRVADTGISAGVAMLTSSGNAPAARTARPTR